MQGLNRKNLYCHKTTHKEFDNPICRRDGIYFPNIDRLHTRSFKSGEPFPLYRCKRVWWILIAKS